MIAIKLVVANGRVADAAITTTRPVRAARVLAGKRPDDVIRLVPLLFPVCGAAQGVACARAIEVALGTAPTAQLERARDLVCLAEAATTHVWQLAVAWSEAAGIASDLVVARAARHALVRLSEGLFGARPMFTALRPDPSLHDARAAVTTLVTLVSDLVDGEAALSAAVVSAGRASFGATETASVATLDVARTGELLATDPAFAEAPELARGPIDVSAYARQAGNEEVHALEGRHGRGLLTRLAARRADARSVLARLDVALEALEQAAPTEIAAREAAGAATVAVDTARGPLVYRVRATPSTVEDVRVVAPTDWTFHPRGVLRAALVGVEAGPTLLRDAGWLAVALDPCVPWAIEVCDA